MQKKIKSWEELQAEVDKILPILNKDQNLMIAAASNPLMALEELGYDLDLDIIGHVEDKLRFKTRQVAQLSKLRKSIHKAAGRKFDVRSPKELNGLLFEELKIEAYDDKGCPIRKFIQAPTKGDPHDDLQEYKELHPVITPLLAFRKIDASVAGFCNTHTYRKIRSGGYGKKSNIRLMARLKKK